MYYYLYLATSCITKITWIEIYLLYIYIYIYIEVPIYIFN